MALEIVELFLKFGVSLGQRLDFLTQLRVLRKINSCTGTTTRATHIGLVFLGER